MTVDYYSLLTKAVAGKDAVARDKIYREAHSLIAKSHLTSEAASYHVVALEDAIRQIENDIAAEEMLAKFQARRPLRMSLSGETGSDRPTAKTTLLTQPDIARLADRDSSATRPSPISRRAHARSNCPCADNAGQTQRSSLAKLDQAFRWKLLWLSDRIHLR